MTDEELRRLQDEDRELVETHYIRVMSHKGWLWTRCLQHRDYSRMMEREFHYDRIKRAHPNRWQTKIYKKIGRGDTDGI